MTINILQKLTINNYSKFHYNSYLKYIKEIMNKLGAS